MKEEKPHLLLVTGIFSPEIGGPASYGHLLGRASADQYTVTVVTYSRVWSESSDRNQPYRVVRVWSRWPWFIRHAAYFIRVVWFARRAKVVCALNAINAAPALWLPCRLWGIPLWVKIVGDRAWEWAIGSGATALMINDFQQAPRQGWARVLHWLQVKSCQLADGVIVPSQYLAGLVTGWGISSEKIHVVYNSVEEVSELPDKSSARTAIGIHGNLLISVGRFVPWKGFRMLVKIMPQLLRINQFFRLVLVGDGPDRPFIEAMIRNLSLDRKVFLVGKKTKTDLAQYLAAADIAILNSGYEGFSHQILEYLMSGIPVIASATGGNPELITQGVNGFLVRYNDEFNLIHAIKSLWEMPDMREQFVTAGLASARRYNPERMIAETLALFAMPHHE